MRRLFVTVALISQFTVATAVHACPFCYGKNGVNEVNSGIFRESFLPTLLAVLAPFPVFFVVVTLLHFGIPFRGATDTTKPTKTLKQ